ncbi:hypothetical protein ACFYO5_33170 [Streptomyces sp. NPDC006259]|uniref:hypothetical protein n=1 Tax=Streptomyces sp. NPDC006259 TaxID=3364740 RepID=UPI00369E8299
MFRGTTARTVVSVLAAALLALPFFAVTSSFAYAHTVRHAEAKAQAGIKPSAESSAEPAREEILTSRPCGRSEEPFDPMRTRDRHRHRTTVAAAPTPQHPERTRTVQDPAAGHRPADPADLRRHLARPSTAHSPAALQVFRC